MDSTLLVRSLVGAVHSAKAMNESKIAGFRAHSDTPNYRKKLSGLNNLCLSVDPSIAYVSFSAGKDSSVVAHAMHAAHPNIEILMVDPGCPTHWIESERELWIHYAKKNNWRLKLFLWSKWTPAPANEDEKQYQKRIHESMFYDLHEHARAHGLECRIMGLRKEESRARDLLVAVKGISYLYKDGGSALLPIARWSVADVWAYIVTHNLPWLDIYNKLGPSARNGLIGNSGIDRGRAEYVKRFYPDAWRWAQKRGIWHA